MDDMIGPSIDGGIQQSLVVTSSRLDTIRQLIKRYMQMNLWISPSDTYAVIVMRERASWYMDFTQDPMLLATAIDELHTQAFEPVFNADSLFEVIERHADLVNPSVHIQAIVFYGRTRVVPTCRTAVGSGICANPRFTLDLLFLHESIRNDPDNTCQAVFDFWIHLSQHGWFYEFAKLARGPRSDYPAL
ncbi:hypothetical protein BX666DRAFT_2024521 [Dichotomocladium elegans]|nr:hypothetical protein BX666DRAFT_2024521 [Dichotomocladium elegans]